MYHRCIAWNNGNSRIIVGGKPRRPTKHVTRKKKVKQKKEKYKTQCNTYSEVNIVTIDTSTQHHPTIFRRNALVLVPIIPWVTPLNVRGQRKFLVSKPPLQLNLGWFSTVHPCQPMSACPGWWFQHVATMYQSRRTIAHIVNFNT